MLWATTERYVKGMKTYLYMFCIWNMKETWNGNINSRSGELGIGYGSREEYTKGSNFVNIFKLWAIIEKMLGTAKLWW